MLRLAQRCTHLMGRRTAAAFGTKRVPDEEFIEKGFSQTI